MIFTARIGTLTIVSSWSITALTILRSMSNCPRLTGRVAGAAAGGIVEYWPWTTPMGQTVATDNSSTIMIFINAGRDILLIIARKGQGPTRCFCFWCFPRLLLMLVVILLEVIIVAVIFQSFDLF